MQTLERALLYVLAGTVSTVLIVDGLEPRRVAVASGGPASSAPGLQAVASVADRPQRETLPERANAKDGRQDSRQIQVLDSSERPRIEFLVDDAGQPQIVLRDATGQPAIRISCDNTGEAQLSLGLGEHPIVLKGTPDGGRRVELPGADGAGILLEMSAEGESLVKAAGRKSQVTIRQNAGGDAEVSIGSADGKGGLAIQVANTGAGSLSLTGKDGQTGPTLQVFEDGLAQMAVHGAANASGPALIRLPDGVAIVSARLPNGQPGASMVVSPDGQSIVAASNSDGSKRAELRVDALGIPTLGVAEGKPAPAPPPVKPRLLPPVKLNRVTLVP
jgi:hypothetical protein